MNSGVLAGVRKQPFLPSVGEYKGAPARILVEPETDYENAILIKSPSWNWGAGQVPYGSGQAIVQYAPDDKYASFPVTDTPAARRVLMRFDNVSGFGLAGGMHVATGRNIPPGATQHIWFDGSYEDVLGIVLVQYPSATQSMSSYQNSAGQSIHTQSSVGSLLVGAPDNAVRYLAVQDVGGNNRIMFISGPGQFGARAIIASGAAALVPLALQGFASQTSDLQEWQNSAGQVLGASNSAGNFKTAAPDAAGRGLLCYDGSGNIVSLLSGQPTPFGAHLQITSGAVGNILMYGKQIASQTGDFLDLANSSGTNLLSILASGQIKSAAANESTGAGSAALGANSPAVTNTAPYKWLKHITSDGSQVYIPAWK